MPQTVFERQSSTLDSMDQSDIYLYSRWFQTSTILCLPCLVSPSFIKLVKCWPPTTSQDRAYANSEATPIAESIETPLGKRSKRFASRLGDSFRRDAYLRRVVAAASVTWPIPRFLLSAWRSGASGGSVSPVSHGLRSAFYYITRSQCTPPKRSSPLRSDRRGNARCTCSRLQPRLAPRNNTPVKHGSRARRIR